VNATISFEWPKALRAVRHAAEDGTLSPRPLFPVEVKALCDLVAGAPLDGAARDVAPGMSATYREETRKKDWTDEVRGAYYFITRFPDGRVWQCSLFTAWIWDVNSGPRFNKATAIKPQNIVQAVTRSIAPEGGER
jgi:hypothetical protein